MKIAYISADRGIPVFGPKGGAVHIRELVGTFASLGHDVHLIAARRGESDGESVAATIVEVTPPDHADGTHGSGDKRQDQERTGLAVADAIADRLLDLHAAGPFDLLYERYSLWSAAGCRAAARLGIPCVVEVNAPLVLEQRKYRRLVLGDRAEAIEGEVFATAHAVVTVSDEVRNYALGRGADPARTYVVPNGVDPERFRPAVRPMPLAAADDRFVVGFSGSLKPWHGLEPLMEAFSLLARRREDYHLLVVGEGPMRQWIEGFVRGAGLADRVTLTGWVSHDDLPRWLRLMDVAVAPYPPISDFYFSPLKVFEYLAAGRPTVASEIGQIGGLIEDGATGLLVRPGDVADLAAAIERLHGGPALRRRIGQAAARRAQDFTWQGNARRIIEIAGALRRAA
ncbi:MAG: glycosyltransferase family 4 protein [Inquilinus sp.]|nr:glycosyltransferase family 4 protein [Inquilinus sp.]